MYEDMDETGESNLYVHHDIILPAFPLSLAWMDCNLADTSATANLAAVCHDFPASFLVCTKTWFLMSLSPVKQARSC